MRKKQRALKRLNPLGKVYTLEALLQLRESWKADAEKVVFTNGVFDLLHVGHVLYLDEAKALGTKLIIGVNSDSSARDLGKGPNRPLNDERARAVVLSALQSVDAVVLFAEPTPAEIIAALIPDVLVKGGDYTPDQIAGAETVLEHGGEVKSLQFVEGYSTTAIEQKIRQSGLDNT